MKTKALVFFFVFLTSISASGAHRNVTSRYVNNPDFEARFAGWHNNGFYYVTNSSFSEKKGMVYMERWVNSGSKVNDVEISQELVGLPVGTYSIVAGCQNVQQANSALTCTGATLYAGDESVEVNANGQYCVVFTVLQGKVKIGFKTNSSTGNWASIDNVRLFSHGVIADSLHIELQKLITEAESYIDETTEFTPLHAAINAAKDLLESSDGDAIAQAAKNLSAATNDYRISIATGNSPNVTTNPFVAAGATIALVRSTTTNNGTRILEKGVCWSTSPEPTINDDHTTYCFQNGGDIFVMEHLDPGKIYYVRAYAISRKYAVAYGNTVKFATLPKGTVTANYDNNGSTEENYRINSAVQEIVWLYNNLTSIKGINLDVHYGSQTPTADCSYGGYMRVGPNSAYQQTGTILHETNHGVGVGTSSPWWSSIYRENGDNGLWLGPRANQMVQFLNNDAGVRITGDNTHMWPTYTINSMNYGINGSWEDIYNPENTLLYYGNVFITHALHQDGLICSNEVGFASGAYVFTQDDDQKYYIKNESDKGGNESYYLTINDDGNLILVPASSKEIKSNDNFAWRILYDAPSARYHFQNVGTGRYITLSSSGYTTIERSGTLYGADGIQLLPSRSNFSKAGVSMTTYWMTEGNKAFTATSETNVASSSFNHENSSSSQRWMFMNEEEMEIFEKYYTEKYGNELNKILTQVKEALLTPHESSQEDVTEEEAAKDINALISIIENEKSGYSIKEIIEAIENLRSTFVAFLTNVYPTDITKPFAISFLINNPDFDENTLGWNVEAKWGNECAEFYGKSYELTQTIAYTLPAGTYSVGVQAFHRPGPASDVYEKYKANNSNIPAFLTVTGTDDIRLKNIFDDMLDKQLKGRTLSFDGKYIPDDMEAAQSWFKAGYYQNTSLTSLDGTQELTLGIYCRRGITTQWTCFDNFTLKYYGMFSKDDIITGIDNTSISQKSKQDGILYNLQGQRVDKNYKGIVIQSGKKIVKK